MTDVSPQQAHARPVNWVLVSAVALATILADQFSKMCVLNSFQEGELLPVIPGFFNLTLAYNPGAAFGLWTGLGEGARQAVLGLTICVALTVVLVFLRQTAHRGWIPQTALAAILGGAIGNIVDRITHGGRVVDFLDFYWSTHHWPAFNVADSAICVGVAALILLPQPKATVKNSSAQL